jgi:hypothetical protein
MTMGGRSFVRVTFFVGAAILAACSGANDSGTSNGDGGVDTGGDAEIPVGTCHLTMSRQSSTNLKAVTLDYGAGDFSDLRCDAGAKVCVVAANPGGTGGLDGFTFTFTQPTTGSGFTLAAVGHDHIELVQPDGANLDSWFSVSGGSTFTEVSATTGTTFSVRDAGMSAESISGNGATGTYILAMQCRGLMITGI